MKDIPYRYVPVDILDKQQFSEEYTKKNLLRQVPILETPEFRLTQSLAIFKYLEAKHASPAMVPSTIELEAKMWEICEIINSGIQPLQNLSLLQKIKSIGGNQKEWAVFTISQGFGMLEYILKETKGNFCVGNGVTFADACLLPQVNNARRYGVDLEKFKIITEIVKNLEGVQEIQKSFPENQPDAPSNSKK